MEQQTIWKMVPSLIVMIQYGERRRKKYFRMIRVPILFFFFINFSVGATGGHFSIFRPLVRLGDVAVAVFMDQFQSGFLRHYIAPDSKEAQGSVQYNAFHCITLHCITVY